jgi:hypothetical protein
VTQIKIFYNILDDYKNKTVDNESKKIDIIFIMSTFDCMATDFVLKVF